MLHGSSRMPSKAEVEKYLRIISMAWGRKQRGYVFFPWIDRDAQVKTGSRRAGFNEGPAFKWPQEREKIIDHMLAHVNHDLYWSTSMFEYPMRREDVAMDEHALWADLDAVDPSTLDEYPPTVAWESSPGRYQALWVASAGDFQGASWPGNENQRMTYYIGADASGWDTVQLLRVPGWANHKPEYRRPDGSYPRGTLLWHNGPRYLPGDFADLPEVQGGADATLTNALESDIEGVDRLAVIARVRLKLNQRARDMLSAREISGDRSSQLWYLIRCLADVGCSVAEIVAVVRETVWNKFRDRSDEVRRLVIEASKAIAQRSEETTQQLEAEAEGGPKADPQRLGALLKNVRRPKYLVDGILTEGACGFIAGEPKCYKSWVGLDLALSVATGADFLGHFRVVNPGPVLYIQEEDPPATLKVRSGKIWVGKATDKMELVPSEGFPEIDWLPPESDEEFDPEINAYIQEGVVVSDPVWQEWLDEVLAKGMDGEPYRLVIIDTLMMTAGDVEENRSQEMTTKVFKPLKVLSRKHNVALQVVHHMGKAEKSRPGQRMLGAVANHAWSEDSIYLSRSGRDDVRIDLESKSSPGGIYRMTNVNNRHWEPWIKPWREDEEPPEDMPHTNRPRTRKPTKQNQLLKLLDEAGSTGLTTKQIAEGLKITPSTAHKRVQRLSDQGHLERIQLPGGTNRWVKL